MTWRVEPSWIDRGRWAKSTATTPLGTRLPPMAGEGTPKSASPGAEGWKRSSAPEVLACALVCDTAGRAAQVIAIAQREATIEKRLLSRRGRTKLQRTANPGEMSRLA